MNKNIHRENEQTVSSKYFVTKSVMDESLSDFQEPKKLSGPKASTKKAKPEKAKKAPKRIRGQKDIRSALKTKKNELAKYAEDFDKVCKHAGLDVDSEELQLAIALSKSLQESSKTDGAETSQSCNTQERVGKIRTTLLEYGFKVPELKKPIPNKRLKKKKNYKLLTTSEGSKKQVVSDKYSQILFKNITVSKKDKTNIEQAYARLFNLATSANYCILKDINTFYVENLMEKSTATCNLLRNWSEIPGRPVSPATRVPTPIMNISEIDCSQDELDIVLSGSLKCCQNIFKSKEKEIRFCNTDIYCGNGAAKDNLDNSVIIIDDEIPKPVGTALDAKECEINLKLEENYIKNNDKAINREEPLVEVDRYRSCSPDLFEDEPSVVENRSQTHENKLHTQENLITPIHTNNVMDLTECDTELKLNYSKNLVNSQTSQKYNVTNRCNDLMEITECIENHGLNTYTTNRNVTKRVSNDFMEITNCVAGLVTPNTIDADIDLTQSPTESNKKDVAEGNETIQDDGPIKMDSDNNQTIDKKDKKKEETLISESNNIDLTESPKVTETSETIQDIHIDMSINPIEIKCDTKQTLVNTDDNEKEEIISIEPINIDLTDSSKPFNDVANDSVESLDLTQSSNTSDELPFVSLKGTKNNSQALIETIMDSKDYEYQNESIAQDDFLDLTQNHHEYPDNSAYFDLIKDNQYKSNDVHTSDTHNQETVANLTQEQVLRKKSRHSQTNVSFFEEYVLNHSDNDASDKNTSNDHKDNNKEVIISEPNSLSVQLNLKDNLSDDIDLTQNTDSSESQNNDVVVNQSIESEGYGDATIEMEICKGAQSDIDLTQNSESEELSQNSQRKKYKHNANELDRDADVEEDVDKNLEIIENDIFIKSSQRCSSLGKKDNISIDYDEINDDLANSSSQQSKSLTVSATDNLSNVSNKSQETSNCSQNSEVFVISDNELDYSMHKSKLEKPVENFMLGGISILNEFSGLSSFRRSTNIENNSAAVNINEANNIIEVDDYYESGNVRTPIKHKRVNELATPQKASCSGISTVVTPSHNEYNIKINDVTPMPKYESMSLEELHTELDKYGVKPFKRKRAIQLLTHIYNETHPILESNSDEETPCKRRKINIHEPPRRKIPRKLTPRKILSPKKTSKSPRKTSANKKSPRKVTGQGKEKAATINDRSKRLTNLEIIQCSNNYEVNETPFIKELHCSPDEWVFQKRETAKVHSCRVPLHIAFHNYVSSRRWLKEAILCYEPVNIDDIHKDLVSYGHRYDPKELLKFMDKKCITVKTTDNDGRNNKRY